MNGKGGTKTTQTVSRSTWTPLKKSQTPICSFLVSQTMEERRLAIKLRIPKIVRQDETPGGRTAEPA